MTVLTPAQRQFIFTNSVTDRFEEPKPFLSGLGALLKNGTRHPERLAIALLPVFIVANVVWVLGSGVNSVLLSSTIRQVSDAIKHSEQNHNSLEASKAQILSPDALKIYASMIQLSNPAHVRYVTDTNASIAVRAISNLAR